MRSSRRTSCERPSDERRGSQAANHAGKVRALMPISKNIQIVVVALLNV
jgi:hypothetical protein